MSMRPNHGDSIALTGLYVIVFILLASLGCGGYAEEHSSQQGAQAPIKTKHTKCRHPFVSSTAPKAASSTSRIFIENACPHGNLPKMAPVCFAIIRDPVDRFLSGFGTLIERLVGCADAYCDEKTGGRNSHSNATLMPKAKRSTNDHMISCVAAWTKDAYSINSIQGSRSGTCRALRQLPLHEWGKQTNNDERVQSLVKTCKRYGKCPHDHMYTQAEKILKDYKQCVEKTLNILPLEEASSKLVMLAAKNNGSVDMLSMQNVTTRLDANSRSQWGSVWRDHSTAAALARQTWTNTSSLNQTSLNLITELVCTIYSHDVCLREWLFEQTDAQSSVTSTATASKLSNAIHKTTCPAVFNLDCKRFKAAVATAHTNFTVL